jgi:hypothetical protein
MTFDRLKSLLGGEASGGVDDRRNSPASNPVPIADAEDDMPDGELDIAKKEAARTAAMAEAIERVRQSVSEDRAKSKREEPPSASEEASPPIVGVDLADAADSPLSGEVVGTVNGGANVRRAPALFQEQLQKAVNDFLDAGANSFRRGDEIIELLGNTAFLNKLLYNANYDTALKQALMPSPARTTVDLAPGDRVLVPPEEAKAIENLKTTLAAVLRNRDLLKIFYFDDTAFNVEFLPNAGLPEVYAPGVELRYNNQSVKQLGTALEAVRLTTENLLGYAKDDERFPTFVLDQKLYIQGVEVSKYLKGSATVTKNNVTGHNTLTFTLDNSHDKFVWTDRNLGFSVFERSYFYDENGDKIFYYSEQDKEYARRLARALNPDNSGAENIENLDAELASAKLDKSFLQYEAAKKKVFDYKTNPNVNPISVDAAGNKLFTRFDLVPNKCVFARMDPIRLFSRYPFRPDTGIADELWMPEFAGFIENVSIEDDDVLGTSTITIECADIRQSILTRMRISSSVSSSLTNPLDLLGLRPLAIFDDGTTNTGNNATPQQQQIIKEVQKVSPRFFRENDPTVTFYDDVVNSVFGTEIPPNMNLESTIRLLLEFKYDLVKKGRARRGVNNIQYGGTFRVPWADYRPEVVYSATLVRDYLQEYHLFTLFGPKRRPWTTGEVDYVGARTITVDTEGQFLGDFTPLNCRLWFLLPHENSGPANLAELTTANIQMAHEANWTNRIEVLRNVLEGVDYQMFVSGTGDIHIEFPFADFRPEDFGIFKDVFRFQRATISTSYSDEAEEPIAGLTVVTGWAAGAASPDPISEAFYQKSFAFSPYIAARYGMNVTQTVSLPYLSINEKPIAQQRAVIEFQKANARCNTLQFQSAYRPFLLPNRPVHHLRRSRIGLIVSSDTTFEIGASPRGSISVGLEHVRTWTGGYRFEAPTRLTDPQKEAFDQRKTKKEVPADEKGSKDSDPYSQQVFVSVMAGTNLPTSARATWSAESPVTANSGVFIIDLQKFNETQIARTPPPEPASPPQDQTRVVDTASPAAVAAPPTKPLIKWAGNPLRGNLIVTSHWAPVRVIKSINLVGPHSGTDFRGRGPLTSVERVVELIAVGNGTVTLTTGRVNENSDAKPVFNLTAANGLRALYVHVAPIGILPKSLVISTEVEAYNKALLDAKVYAVEDYVYRAEYKRISDIIAAQTAVVTSKKSTLQQVKDATTALQSAKAVLARLVVPEKPTSRYYMKPGSSYPVKTGDTIGLMSNTGNSYGVHLHFETIDDQNPLRWPYEYTELLPRGVSRLPDGSPKVDSFYYLPGPLTGQPHKEASALDAKIRADLESINKK